MPRGECSVVLHDGNQLGTNVGLEELSGHLSMSDISEDLADVMAQGGQDQLIVRTRKLGTSCNLQSVIQLTDLTAVADVRQAGKQYEYTLGSATLPTYAVH